MKIFLTLTVLLTFFISPIAHAQNLITKAFSSAIDEALDIETDNSGNSYLTGFVGGNSTFGTLNSTGNGGQDIFVAKMDNQGNFLWLKTFGGSGVERGLDIALDNNGNAYVTGYFFGTVNFGGTSLSSNSGSRDLFVTKLSTSNGNVVWAKKLGGSDAETGHSVTCDNAGNVIVVGQFEGSLTIGSNTYTTPLNTMSNTPAQGVLIVKYNSAGVVQWSKVGVSDFNNRAIAVHHDASNNIYLTGNFSDDLLIDGTTISNQQLNAGFVAKFTPTGSMDWFRKIAANTISPIDLEIRGTELFITGDFQGSLIFYGAASNETLVPIYNNNFFLLKLSLAGAYTWGKKIGSDNFLQVKSIALNSSGESFLTGTFECNLEEIRPDYGTALWTSIGGKDIFAMKFSASGNRVWDRHQGGLKDDLCYGIALESSNNPMICGSFRDQFYMAQNGPALFPSYISSSDKMILSGCGVNTGLKTGNNIDILIFEPYINNSQPPFNYFIDNSGLCQDSIPANFIPNVDTLEGCSVFSVDVFNSYMYGGPEVAYYLNGVNYAPTYNLSSTGDYYVEVSRLDGCGSSEDSIYINILPSPPTIWLTDDVGVNFEDDPYNDIYLCSPDTVNIQLDDVPPNLDVTIMFGGSVISDTNWANNLHQEGSYQVLLENEDGCMSTSTLQIHMDTTEYDTIVPYLSLLDLDDYNDSISICEGESISVYALDSITNPVGNNIIWDGIYMEASWNDNPFDSINNAAEFQEYFWPDTTGWEVVQFRVVIGYDNACGTHLDTLTVIDSFFVEVLALPNVDISIDSSINICPGGTGLIVADTSLPNFTWSGPGIVSISPDNTTVVVDQPGGYVLQGNLTNPQSGCSSNIFLAEFVSVKPIPQIMSSVSPAFICPGDSIQLVLPDPALSYNWIGPNGNSVGSTQSIFVTDDGDYYCVIMDEDSCQLVSANISVIEYTTPNIDIIGTPALCANDSLYLEVAYYGNPIFDWQPTGDTTAGIMVYDPGYYYCTIELCGITTTDSIEVIDATIAPPLNVGDTLFCPGDSIYVETTAGMANYNWSPNGENTAGIWVSQPGNYYVSVTSSSGCTENSDTVFIGYFLGNENMDFPDTTLCVGDAANFTYTGNGTIEWYVDNNLVSSQNTYTVPTLTDPFTVVYTIDRPYCGPYTDSFTVELSELPDDITLLMDDEYCYNDTLVLAIQEQTDNYTWSTSNGDQYAGNNFVIYPIDANNSGMYYISASNTYCSVEDSMYITVHDAIQLQLNEDTSFICKTGTDEVYDATTPNNELFWEFDNSFFTDDDILFVDQYFEDGYYIIQGLDTNDCPLIPDSVQVYNTNNHNFFVQLDTASCIHTDLTLFADEIPNTTFYWTLPDGSNYYDANIELIDLDSSDMGWYTVEIEVWGNCDFSDSLYLDVYSPFEFNIGNDTLICRKEFFGILPPDGMNNFYWEDGSDDVPYFVYANFNTIILTNEDENGCFYSDTMLLELNDCIPIVPNVITVNGDGMNDYFIIKNSEKHPRNRLEIINRWGNPIYEKDHYDNTFNGQGLSDGTYFYIYYEDTNDKDAKPYTGFLQIIND